jgi:PI31 proteasome regulator N-terminal
MGLLFSIRNTSKARMSYEATMDEADWETEFDAVRHYLVQSPMSSKHPAVVAALQGLDQEVKRRHRDAKLQQKFSTVSSSTSINSRPVVMGDVEMDAVTVEVPSKAAKPLERKPEAEANLSMADDWQDIVGEEEMPSDDTNTDGEAGVLGTEMAKRVVTLLAAHQVACASPPAALAVALHTVLWQCDFICTGVPERAPSAGGFAAPVRDLPVGQLLPPHWEVPVNGIQWRYRHGTVSGSYVLSVATISEEGESDVTVQVSLTGNSIYSSFEPFQFPLSDHMNLHSWTVAQQKSDGKISPVLHYKALAPLLTKFMEHFSLKTKEKEKDVTVPMIDESYLQARYLPELEARPICHGIPNPPKVRDVSDPMHPAVVNAMQTSRAAPRPGAFDGDLHPLGGLYPPPDGTLFPGGNLMGPNHPLFTGGGVHPPGGGMHPRFDPFGPPGGPTEPLPPPVPVDPPGTSFPAGGTGNPNNDLAIPPPFGGNNMFL